MVPMAYLRGLRTVKDSVDDPYINDFLRKAVYEEIIPTLDLPKEELVEFADAVIERFQNPYIRHELISIALNSVSKFKVRVLPSLLEYKKLNQKLPVKLTDSLAALILFYKGEYGGKTIPLADTKEVIEFMKHAWGRTDTREVVSLILSNKNFWDMDLTEIDGLTDSVIQSMERFK
jgi:tagaturonate reductase